VNFFFFYAFVLFAYLVTVSSRTGFSLLSWCGA